MAARSAVRCKRALDGAFIVPPEHPSDTNSPRTLVDGELGARLKLIVVDLWPVDEIERDRCGLAGSQSQWRATSLNPEVLFTNGVARTDHRIAPLWIADD